MQVSDLILYLQHCEPAYHVCFADGMRVVYAEQQDGMVYLSDELPVDVVPEVAPWD